MKVVSRQPPGRSETVVFPETAAMIRVMVVDDHDMVRRGLAAILRINPDMELVGQASDGQEALAVCAEVQPHVILMDMVMPHMDGAAATQIIRHRHPGVQVIAMTSFKEKSLVESALEAGAIAFLLKNVSAEELAQAIRSAAAGRQTLAPEAAEVLGQAKRLERLARALVATTADTEALHAVLSTHVPGIVGAGSIEIRRFPGDTLLLHPPHDAPADESVWHWIAGLEDAQCFLPGAKRPWPSSHAVEGGCVVAPIVAPGADKAIGGIVLRQPQDGGLVADCVPAVKSMAAQVSSAIIGARARKQEKAQELVARELTMAGQIQASFLPRSVPQAKGWELAASLEPARETSGDFYDLIPLPANRLGLVVADVADKGMGAALYMALARTLIRTYAARFPNQPSKVLQATNSRMLTDAGAGLFVTVFYGVLDTATGSLKYCRAGHVPPYVVQVREGRLVELRPPGMALGVRDTEIWEPSTEVLPAGALLVVCTDGLVEALDPSGQIYGRQRFERLLRQFLHRQGSGWSAEEVRERLASSAHTFAQDLPLVDDMTILVVRRTEKQAGYSSERSRKMG
jgi:serine phosphatase RsbU (regulator of sigma subunit)/DNA-binding NarL/FixJ family response regulator